MSEAAWTEEELGRLLAALRPAPRGWVEAAAQLPHLRLVIDELVERAEADAAFRTALIADLESAVAGEGVEPTERVLRELRTRLS